MNTKRLLWIAAAIFLVSGTANAALVLTLDDPSTSGVDLRIVDQDSNDTSRFPGVVGFSSTTIGGVPVSTVTGISKPAEGSVSSPVLEFSFQSGSSTGAGLLIISVTDTDFNANLAYKATLNGGTGGTLQLDFFGDSKNKEFGKSFNIGSTPILTPGFSPQIFQSAANQVGSLTISADIGFTSSFKTTGFQSQIEAVNPVPITYLSYTPVTPCRIVDTRKTGAGIIDANTQRNFRVFGSVGSQGGNSGGCSSPGGQPRAAHINMIAVDPTGKGNLQSFPVGAGTGAGLSVNYNTIDTNLANAGTVKTVTGSGPDITVASNFSSAHTVIDVLGYYYPDEGFYYTPVDPCRIVDTRKTSAGIIDVDTERDFRVFGPVSDQGGNPAGCPSTLGVSPEAAHLNMIAVDPADKGNLQAFPVGTGPGAGLSVNYNTIDTNLANAGSVKTATGSGPDITVASNFSSAHTVIDVLGYYSEEEDLLYTPVKPCRIVDTRKTGAGIIDANTQRNFRVFGSVGSQGGNSGGCSSPGGQPRAAHINMIAVDPTGKGNLQSFPVGAGTGAGLSVNYNTIDTNLANAGTVKTITGSGPDITVRSNFSSAHTVIDVLGYYYPAP